MSKQTIIVNPAFCPQNHPCPSVSICPHGAIKQDNPYSAPKIVKELCTDCGMCTRTCRAFQKVSV